MLKQLLHLSARVRQHEEEQEEERIRQSPTQTVLNCFMLGWFIIGKNCTGLIQVICSIECRCHRIKVSMNYCVYCTTTVTTVK